jgi:predicted ABC-type transport system involved in lysophospholipase L1 biosynthesis ATPase subunit
MAAQHEEAPLLELEEAPLLGLEEAPLRDADGMEEELDEELDDEEEYTSPIDDLDELIEFSSALEAACREDPNLLAAVGLADKSARLGNQLSGGEQQRVAIARALANDPALILADEPTGNLDHTNADRVFALLSDLVHARGQSLLMVSHNPDLAARCDHVFHMKDGLILA